MNLLSDVGCGPNVIHFGHGTMAVCYRSGSPYRYRQVQTSGALAAAVTCRKCRLRLARTVEAAHCEALGVRFTNRGVRIIERAPASTRPVGDWALADDVLARAARSGELSDDAFVAVSRALRGDSIDGSGC